MFRGFSGYGGVLDENGEGSYQAIDEDFGNPEEEKEVPLWTMRDGQKIAVKDMSDHHLLTSAAMLKRRGFIGMRALMSYLLGPGPNGEMAQDAFQAEMDEVFERPVNSFVDAFADEIVRRGLKI